jgi:hypothetical protein
MGSLLERAAWAETCLPKSQEEIIAARRARRAPERDRGRDYVKLMKLQVSRAHGSHCVICGYDRNIAVLDFHHINPVEKEGKYRKCVTMEESMKCILLCSNCHREHHHGGVPYDR